MTTVMDERNGMGMCLPPIVIGFRVLALTADRASCNRMQKCHSLTKQSTSLQIMNDQFSFSIPLDEDCIIIIVGLIHSVILMHKIYG